MRGYVAPEIAAATLAKALKKRQSGTESRILDVGAGTGQVAEHLQRMGFNNIDGLDASKEMLAIAKRKNVYRNCFQDVLGPRQPLNLNSNSYDATICVGVFTRAHVKAKGAMEEIVRVVKPGGLVCFTIRENVFLEEEYGYGRKMDELSLNMVWELVSVTVEAYHSTFDLAKCFLYLYQVL